MHKHSGFSLVELSIVLVILGLLVGGVLGGQSLIKAAELRSISEEQKEYTIALNAFKDKYRGLPGDLRNAGKFWGYVNQDNTAGTNCDSMFDVGTDTETCDGNGNGKIDNRDGLADMFSESLRFWQHLGNAGMVTGTYIGGVADDDLNNALAGTHFPEAKYQGGRWLPATDTINNFFMFFSGTSVASTAHVLNGEDAWNIDSKFDDGKPIKA